MLGYVRNVSLGQVSLAQLGQVRLGQVRLGQVRLGQVRLGQVRLGQMRLDEVRLGQMRLGQHCQFKLGQVRLGQVVGLVYKHYKYYFFMKQVIPPVEHNHFSIIEITQFEHPKSPLFYCHLLFQPLIDVGRCKASKVLCNPEIGFCFAFLLFWQFREDSSSIRCIQKMGPRQKFGLLYRSDRAKHINEHKTTRQTNKTFNHSFNHLLIYIIIFYNAYILSLF